MLFLLPPVERMLPNSAATQSPPPIPLPLPLPLPHPLRELGRLELPHDVVWKGDRGRHVGGQQRHVGLPGRLTACCPLPQQPRGQQHVLQPGGVLRGGGLGQDLGVAERGWEGGREGGEGDEAKSEGRVGGG